MKLRRYMRYWLSPKGTQPQPIMRGKMPKYNDQEIKALIAPILGLNPEDVDTFIIVSSGACVCGKRDGIVTYTNVQSMTGFEELISCAIITQIVGE
jgi:hypothetical protein